MGTTRSLSLGQEEKVGPQLGKGGGGGGGGTDIKFNSRLLRGLLTNENKINKKELKRIHSPHLWIKHNRSWVHISLMKDNTHRHPFT